MVGVAWLLVYGAFTSVMMLLFKYQYSADAVVAQEDDASRVTEKIKTAWAEVRWPVRIQIPVWHWK